MYLLLSATLETPCKVLVHATFSFHATTLTCTHWKTWSTVQVIFCIIFFQLYFSKVLRWGNRLFIHLTNYYLNCRALKISSLKFFFFKEIRPTFLISQKKTNIGAWRDQYQDLLVWEKWYWPPLCVGQYTPINLDSGLFKHQSLYIIGQHMMRPQPIKRYEICMKRNNIQLLVFEETNIKFYWCERWYFKHQWLFYYFSVELLKQRTLRGTCRLVGCSKFGIAQYQL